MTSENFCTVLVSRSYHGVVEPYHNDLLRFWFRRLKSCGFRAKFSNNTNFLTKSCLSNVRSSIISQNDGLSFLFDKLFCYILCWIRIWIRKRIWNRNAFRSRLRQDKKLRFQRGILRMKCQKLYIFVFVYVNKMFWIINYDHWRKKNRILLN
jgi:hypothetical protein